MPFLQLDNVVKRYGEAAVIKGVSLAVEKGEFIVFVGPSGCGKSTLLRMIAGLENVSDGRIHIDGRDVTHVEPARREVAMVFQSYALYPHMSVYDNMAFGLRMTKTAERDIRARVLEAARILQIEPLLERRPRQLSGGQRQRVAIGRAIVRKPKLFLFDEPLSNLDAELRTQMRVEIARLHKALGATMVYVTHDQIEAMTLADRIAVLREGVVEQCGTPAELYDHPGNIFVGGFIGSPRMNFLVATVTTMSSKSLTLRSPAFTKGAITIPLRNGRKVETGEKITIGLRPEHLTLGGKGAGLTLRADIAENLGGATQIHTRTESDESIVILAPGRPDIVTGQFLAAGISPEKLYLFDKSGRAF